MSAISVRPTGPSRGSLPPSPSWGAPRPHGLARLRIAAGRLGSPGIAAAGFLLALGWAFAGSLWLRLGSSPPPPNAIAWRWLAGEGLIIAVSLAGLWLCAGGEGGGPEQP